VVRLEADWRVDSVDRYGRLLRYVHRGALNLNLELVRRGAATVWFYHGERGRYAAQLLAAARRARAERLGLWGACKAVWDPYGPATTSAPSARRTGTRKCDPSYPDVCIPPPPPDLDCSQIPYRNFRVVGADPHHFDGDHDGIGCER
jgi:micrococcal nuclease